MVSEAEGIGPPVVALVLFKIIYLFLFYGHWCFACTHVCVKVLEAQELELQTGVS